jgi:hypothetical protein
MGLIWLVLAGIVVWALVRLGRQTEGPRRGHWRVAATLVSAALLVGGALALSKGAWISGLGLVGAALWLVVASRMRTVAIKREAIGDVEARSILGVPVGAEPEEIQAAWRRLMGRAHPDQGGTEGLAAKLNAARDWLLKK